MASTQTDFRPREWPRLDARPTTRCLPTPSAPKLTVTAPKSAGGAPPELPRADVAQSMLQQAASQMYLHKPVAVMT
jgi:hypothetical protein